MAQTHINKTVKFAGAAADYAEDEKVKKYAGLADRFDFYPIGFETFDILGQIGERIKEHTGDLRTMDFLRQKISIEIQRGNAVSVLGTVQQPSSLDAPFFLLGLRNC